MPVNCKYQNCKKRASWGFKFQEPEYCPIHGNNMNAFPQYRICKCGSTRPTYGFTMDLRASCCKKCLETNMVNLINKRCEEDGCDKVSTMFDFPDGRGRYCSEHKKDGMINLKHVNCNENGCKKTVAYDLPGGKGKYCAEHKKDGMIDIKHPKCIESGCNIINPIYGNKSDNQGIYCKKHKKDGMVNVRNKVCNYENCEKRPSYALKNESPLYCFTHKKNDMVNVTEKLCIEPNCLKQPTFNIVNSNNPLYCLEHKKGNMVNVTSKHCPGPPGLEGPDGKCPLGKFGNTKYNYYCCECFARAFPTDPRTHLIHKKSDEIYVRDFISSNFSSLNFIHDKPLWLDSCNCSHKRRVDLRCLIDNTILVIEIDEYQHKDRDTNDEELRYNDLYMLHSGKWIFIRYNPHIYKDATGKKANPWKEKRLTILKDEINMQLKRIYNHENHELLEVYKLFFDGFKPVT